MLTINDEEARLLSGEYFEESSKSNFKNGAKYLIIKKGEHGALLFNEENIFMLQHCH